MNQLMLFFIIVVLATGCKSSHAKNIYDPLTTYWQIKVHEKNYNNIERQIKKKLDEIEDELYKIDLEMDRLKEPGWRNQVHGIYSNIQQIRNKSIEPMKTLNEDDI